MRKKEKLKNLPTLSIFERIINGSFPEVNSASGRHREQFYETYIRTYLERDIRELINKNLPVEEFLSKGVLNIVKQKELYK